MSLLMVDDDPWLLEYESCEKLNRDINEQLSLRAKHARTSDKYSQISVAVRLRLKQYNNEVSQLNLKLEDCTKSRSITSAESERRMRQIEVLHSKGVLMQKLFEDQAVNKFNEDRRSLIGSSSDWNGEEDDRRPRSVDELKADQRRMLGEQEQGLDTLAGIISRQKNIAQTISDEVEFHHELLDDLGNRMDGTDSRVRNETAHIGVVTTKDKTCAYWVVIVLLFISILVVSCI